MANSDKNILITPSVGLSTNPTIIFNGANNTPTTLRVLDDGTISFEGTAGQLFSISDGLTGSIFSVNDISGIPSIEVLDTGLVKVNQYSGSTVFGASAAIQNSSSVNAKVSISTASASTPGLIIKAVSSQTANLQEWQNSVGGVDTAVTSTGRLSVRTTLADAGLNVGTPSAATVGAIIRGVTSQTADLQQWQNSSGTIISRIYSDGSAGLYGLYVFTGGASITGNYGNTDTLQVTISGAARRGILVKGAASQTANLQEWQNSSSTVLTNITSDGLIETNNGIRFYATSSRTGWSTLANNLGNLGFNYALTVGNSGSGANLATLTSYAISASTIGLVVRGAASQTANVFEVQNSSGYPMVFVDAYGALKAQASGMYVNSGYASGTGIVVRGYASQTANLQEWQNSSGTVLARINSSGNLATSNVTDTASTGSFVTLNPSGTNNGAVLINTRSSSNKGLIVFGVASQTANLQEWQDSAGSALAFINANGALSVQGFLIPSATGELSLGGTIGGTEYTNSIIFNSANSTSPIHRIRWTGGGSGNPNWEVGTNTTLQTNKNWFIRYVEVSPNVRDYIPYRIQGTDGTNIFSSYSGQTTDLMQWKNSSGSVISKIGNVGNFVIGGSSTLAQLSVYAGAAATVGLAVRGAASQTADLQQWQGSAGTVLANIDSNGNFVLNPNQTATTFPLRIWTQGSPTTPYGLAVTRNGQSLQYIHIHESDGSKHVIETAAIAAKPFYIRNNQAESLIFGTNGSDKVNINSTGNVLINGFTASTVGLTVKAAASQTANVFEVQNSSGYPMVFVDAYGALKAQASGMYVNSGYASGTGITVSGYASQTADLQQWRNSAGSVLSKVTSNGSFQTGGGSWTKIDTTYGQVAIRIDGSLLGSLSVGTGNSEVIGLVVKAVASQTANLQEWQDNSGTVLAKVDANGAIKAAGLNIAGQEVSSNINLLSGYRYFVDTTAARTLTLPASPLLGDEIQIFDASNLAGTNNITVDSNNAKIEGVIEQYSIDVNGAAVTMIYTGSTFGWKVRI